MVGVYSIMVIHSLRPNERSCAQSASQTLLIIILLPQGQQAEVQQYKHQLELLNQQTQRLVAVYQQDDTRLIRRRSDALNARFNNLQSK